MEDAILTNQRVVCNHLSGSRHWAQLALAVWLFFFLNCLRIHIPYQYSLIASNSGLFPKPVVCFRLAPRKDRKLVRSANILFHRSL